MDFTMPMMGWIESVHCLERLLLFKRGSAPLFDLRTESRIGRKGETHSSDLKRSIPLPCFQIRAQEAPVSSLVLLGSHRAINTQLKRTPFAANSA